MSGVARRIGALLCLLLLLGAVPAMAQVSTGEVFGKATDGTGAVLPGVTVTLSGPSLIQPMVAISSETGAYRFPRIPIGTYTVNFELTGFKKYVRSDIIIQAGFNAEVNAKLEISTVQETVTVTGESPVVDTKSTTMASSFNRETLEKIPNARDPWVIIEQTPGMVMSGVNVGGNLSGQQTSFNAMGSGTNQQWNINGAVVSDIASGNSSPTYYDFDSFEEIQITTAGADAAQQGAGVQINFVTRSGSNNFTGYGRFYNTNDKCFGEFGSCQSLNVTDDLRKQNVGGGNPIQDIRDVGAQLGGPIMKNKAWFWGAMSRQDTRVGVVGFFDQTNSSCASLISTSNPASATNADGSFKFGLQDIKNCLFGDLTTLKNYNGRFQYQEAAGHQTEFSYTYGDKTRTSRGCDAFHPLISCSKQTGPTIFYTPSHRWIVSNNLTIIGQYTHIHEDWFLGFEDPSLIDVQAINWVDTSYWDRSKSSAAYHTIRPQDDGRADGNYFKSNWLGADHSIKFGFAFRRSPVESISSVGGGAVARYRGQYQFAPGAFITALDTTVSGFATNKNACVVNGVSYAANTATGCDEADIQRDADYNYTLYQRNFYVQDSIKKGRATINVGLRFDHQHDIATPGTVPANRILPTQLPAINFPGADSGVRYNDWAPRIGLVYDLTGTGKSVLKATYNRYYGLGVFTAAALEPTGTTTTLRFPWKDLNGDKVVQANELQVFKADGRTLNLLNSPAGYDPANPGSPVTTAKVDSNMTNDVTNEFIFGLDHEVMTNFAVGAMYIYRKYTNFCGSASQQCVGNAVRYLDSTDLYLSGGAQTFTAACGNSLCGQSSYTGQYYNISRALNSNTIQENVGQYRTYNGIELTARKRLSHHYMVTGSYVYNRELNYTPLASIDYLDPTNHSPIDLVSGYEDGTRNSPHVFKVSGLYQLPYDINASASYNAHSNFPFNPNITTGTRPNGIGTVAILLYPTNSLRYPTVQTLDLNFDKSIRFGGPRRITLNMAIFNVTNSNTVLAQTVRQNTATANYVTTIIGPRVIRFGARINF
jgi:carboxypeptidase family protein